MSKTTLNCYQVVVALRSAIRLKAYRDCLVEEGFQVTLANNGLACMNRLRDVIPDVLILERDLPWGGGDGVLARLDEDLDIPKVPLILLSGYPRHADVASMILTDRQYVDSDMRPKELAALIGRFFSQLAFTSDDRERRPASVSFASER